MKKLRYELRIKKEKNSIISELIEKEAKRKYAKDKRLYHNFIKRDE